jgi:dTDP-glucose 4,6-dehydratase
MGDEGFSVSIARCFAFVGPWLPFNQHFAIGNFIADGLAGRSIKVKANNLVYRSYMYADDLVDWMIGILVSANSNCPTFNLGSDEEISIGELANKIATCFKVSVDAESIIYEKIDRYIPSVKKAFEELGLVCEYDLDQAIHKTLFLIRGRGN